MTPQEFAERIRAKYPDGVASDGRKYTDISDDELTQKVVAKYPVYASQVEMPKKNTLGKVTETVNKMFPGKELGKTIGNSIYGLGQLAKGNTEEVDKVIQENRESVGRVAGDVVNAVSTAGGFAGVGTSGGLIKKALGSSAVGTGMFGGQAAAEGKDVGEIMKTAIKGAVVGGATSGALSVVGGTVNHFRKLPERLIRSATGQSKKEILAGKSLEKFILENKKVGTADKLIRDSKEVQTKLNALINNNLKSVPITKTKVTTSSLLDDIVAKVNEQGGAVTKAEAREIITRLAPQAKGLLAKPSMSLVTANKLRQSIDKTIGDAGFLRAELPFNKEILRSFTNALRESVKSKAPEGTRAAFNTLSNEIRLSEALANKIAQGSRNQIISFGDLIGGGLGGVAGGVPGALAGAAARRAIQSTPFLTGSAVAIDSLDRTLSPILNQLEPSVQTAILAAIREALNDEISAESDVQVE